MTRVLPCEIEAFEIPQVMRVTLIYDICTLKDWNYNISDNFNLFLAKEYTPLLKSLYIMVELQNFVFTMTSKETSICLFLSIDLKLLFVAPLDIWDLFSFERDSRSLYGPL